MSQSPTSGDFDQLLGAARVGDRAALGQLWAQCYGYLVLLAKQKLDPDQSCKVSPSDLVQETFLEAQRDLPQFHGAGRDELLAWLGQVLHHNIANVTRRFRGAEMRTVVREVPLAGSEELALQTPTPSERAVAREDVQALQEALRRLPEHYQQVVRLRYQDGMTFAQIGEVLNCSDEAARKLWARAVGQLQRQMDLANDS